jgi:hypothetical protein
MTGKKRIRAFTGLPRRFGAKFATPMHAPTFALLSDDPAHMPTPESNGHEKGTRGSPFSTHRSAGRQFGCLSIVTFSTHSG